MEPFISAEQFGRVYALLRLRPHLHLAQVNSSKEPTGQDFLDWLVREGVEVPQGEHI